MHFYIGEGDLQVSWTYWLAGYCVLMSLVSFIQFGVDKRRARRRQWRIPEKVLFMTAMAGGSPGAILGMARLSPQNAAYEFPCGPSHDPDFADLCLCGDLLSTPIGMDYLDAEVHIL